MPLVRGGSVAQSSPILCDSMDCSRPGFPVLHHFPEFAQTHVLWVGDHPLFSPSPAFNLSQHQGLFWVNSFISLGHLHFWASQVALVVKNSLANAGDKRDVGSASGWGRFPGGGSGTPFQYSCLENPMDRGAWGATVHGVTKSQTRLKAA